MEKTRFDRGMDMLKEVDGAGGDAVIKSLEGIAPDLGRYIVEFAFGDIYSREGLDVQEREMVTVASLLTAGGCEPQLEVHINGALNVGLTPEKIIEVFMQCVPYVGFPRVLNAVFTAKKIFEGREREKPSVSFADSSLTKGAKDGYPAGGRGKTLSQLR